MVLLINLIFGFSLLHSEFNAFFNKEYSESRLKKHVAFLSSDDLEGRLTGTQGEQLAAQYAATYFKSLGLEPAGDNGTFFQKFNFTAGVSLSKNNSFKLINSNGLIKKLKLNEDWRPLSFSDNGSFNTSELIFAGYGITAPASGAFPSYDSYQNLNVKNKWVLVFRYSPEKIDKEQIRHLAPYISPRYKVFTAKEHGAKGVIFVSGPNSRVNHELIPLAFDASFSGSGIAAISVTDKVASSLLENTPHSLKKLQDALDAGHLNKIPSLKENTLSGLIEIQQNKQTGHNVLARLKIKAKNAQTIVLSAHLDHLGRGTMNGSRGSENERAMIHNGADDNASGVAVVLETAMALSQLNAKQPIHGNKDILFALWSGEELGLLGSSSFMQKYQATIKNDVPGPPIIANINMDMIGRLQDKLVIQGIASSTAWLKLIHKIIPENILPLITQDDPYLPTDSTSFYLQGIPAINLFTGAHDEYHTTRDKADTLNYPGLNKISHFVIKFILALESYKQPIDYQQRSKPHNIHGRGFRVYLGTIPDYSNSNASGMKLAGVRLDSPAHQAGLKQNDVIVRLAGKKIHDIYDYTFVMGSLVIGDTVDVVVVRDQKELSLKITAKSRD